MNQSNPIASKESKDSYQQYDILRGASSQLVNR